MCSIHDYTFHSWKWHLHVLAQNFITSLDETPVFDFNKTNSLWVAINACHLNGILQLMHQSLNSKVPWNALLIFYQVRPLTPSSSNNNHSNKCIWHQENGMQSACLKRISQRWAHHLLHLWIIKMGWWMDDYDLESLSFGLLNVSGNVKTTILLLVVVGF